MPGKFLILEQTMNKLYVLVRKDLSPSYQAVQAGHAVAEWLLQNHQGSEWKNNTLIYLGVKDLDDLNHWIEKLKYKNIEFSAFKEPDIGNEITAIACLDDGKLFSKLRLL